MQRNMINRWDRVMMLGIMTSIIGCESEDERLAEYAQQASAQQARQNEHIAAQAQEVSRHSQVLTAATHDLVEQDAMARRELLQAQHTWQQVQQQEQVNLDQQRQQVAMERQAATVAAVRDPVVAQAVLNAGLVLAALVPLIVTVYALHRLPQTQPADEILGDALLASWLERQPADSVASSEYPSMSHGARTGITNPAPPHASETEPPF